MKTLNKDRINILKLNIQDFLYTGLIPVETQNLLNSFFRQIISWRMPKMWWLALKLKTDKQDPRFTTLLILFREENEKWSDDLYASTFASFLSGGINHRQPLRYLKYSRSSFPLWVFIWKTAIMFQSHFQREFILNKLLSRTDRQRQYITYMTKWSA